MGRNGKRQDKWGMREDPSPSHLSSRRLCRGVAMGWPGVDISTPLLPEVVPEIDANPMSLYPGGGGVGSIMV